MTQAERGKRRGSIKISLPVGLENELRELAKEEGKTISETANWWLEWAMEKRHRDYVMDSIYDQARGARIMIDQVAIEHFGMERHGVMVDEITALVRKELKDMRS